MTLDWRDLSMEYPLVTISVFDFGNHFPVGTQWRESGSLALIQCYSALPDFPVNVAADMLELGRHCQGDFPPDDRDVHARLA